MTTRRAASVYRFWLVDQFLVPIVLNFAINWVLVLCVMIVALPTLGILNLLGLTHFALRTCLAVNASYAALLAAVTSPLIAVTAVAQFSREGITKDVAERSAAV